MTESDVPLEANEADALEQGTPVEEPAPNAGPQGGAEVDDGDLAESRREVPVDDDERR
jgi:hypothetical protein